MNLSKGSFLPPLRKFSSLPFYFFAESASYQRNSFYINWDTLCCVWYRWISSSCLITDVLLGWLLNDFWLEGKYFFLTIFSRYWGHIDLVKWGVLGVLELFVNMIWEKLQITLSSSYVIKIRFIFICSSRIQISTKNFSLMNIITCHDKRKFHRQ